MNFIIYFGNFSFLKYWFRTWFRLGLQTEPRTEPVVANVSRGVPSRLIRNQRRNYSLYWLFVFQEQFRARTSDGTGYGTKFRHPCLTEPSTELDLRDVPRMVPSPVPHGTRDGTPFAASFSRPDREFRL